MPSGGALGQLESNLVRFIQHITDIDVASKGLSEVMRWNET
jgi:hypothetical protein